jgi:hypothetical protein
MLRKSCVEAVAIPSIACSNAFWTARVNTGSVAPIPRPVAIMRRTREAGDVVADIRDMKKSATVARASPDTAIAL